MFEKGDLVIYGTKGVCRIEDIRVPDIEGVDRLYYFLQPVYDARDMIFTPVDSDKVKMRKTLDKEQAEQFIDELKEKKTSEEFTERINAGDYNEVMRSGNCMSWAHLINNLYKRKKGCAIRGKKMKYTDTKVLKEAERLLYGELAAALDQSYEDTFKELRPILY
ncbi:MAG: CarD family transcriptional regulator [Lachnospiraceae bacterium]